ncbi:hypothetical protein FIU86_18920 [Roseovarius sp. THAF9]|nr:hypothetical protein FIU86_18920 [Roseovarius sp. THAF9]
MLDQDLGLAQAVEQLAFEQLIPQPGKTERGAALGTIAGIVPSLVGDVTGCAFRTRCPHAIPACREAIPLRGTDSHDFRCVHADGALSKEGDAA